MLQEQIWQSVQQVRQQGPLVHNITNYVVMNNTANALLAAGASPVMAHAQEEVQDMVSIAGALVVNIGTLDGYWVKSMQLAIERAAALQKPWVLDPVGAGATHYRNQVIGDLLEIHAPSVIRGNASEIMSVAKFQSATKGVDSVLNSGQAIQAASLLSKKYHCVVVVSGAVDYIVSANKLLAIHNGSPMMAAVTGMGCTASALTGAFCAVLPHAPFDAAVAAMSLMGVAGELAAQQAAGPGSLQLHFLDALHSIDATTFVSLLNTC